MSHVTEIRLRLRDLDALEEAAEKCGLELVRGEKTFAWWGTFAGDSRPPAGRDPKDYGTCEHALRVKGETPRNGSRGPWSIGVAKAVDGDGYDVLFDAYGSAGQRLLDRIEPDGSKLRREYACAVAERNARKTLAKKGFRVEREDLPGNRIRLKLRKR